MGRERRARGARERRASGARAARKRHMSLRAIWGTTLSGALKRASWGSAGRGPTCGEIAVDGQWSIVERRPDRPHHPAERRPAQTTPSANKGARARKTARTLDLVCLGTSLPVCCPRATPSLQHARRSGRPTDPPVQPNIGPCDRNDRTGTWTQRARSRGCRWRKRRKRCRRPGSRHGRRGLRAAAGGKRWRADGGNVAGAGSARGPNPLARFVAQPAPPSALNVSVKPAPLQALCGLVSPRGALSESDGPRTGRPPSTRRRPV